MKSRKNKSFTNRIFLSICSTSIILMLVGTFLIYYRAADSLNLMNIDTELSNVDATRQLIDESFASVDDLVRLVFYQDRAYESAKKDTRTDKDAYLALHTAINSVLSSSRLLLSIRFLDRFGGMVSTSQKGPQAYSSLSQCRRYYAKQPVHSGDGTGTVWYYLQEDLLSGEKYAIANVRNIIPLPSVQQDPPLLVVVMSEMRIRKLYDTYGNGSCIITPEGVMVSALDEEKIGSKIDEGLLRNALMTKEGSRLLYRDGLELCYCARLSQTGCYLIVKPKNEGLSAYKLLPGVIVVIILSGLIMTLIWSRHLSRWLTIPLYRLKGFMEKVREGDLSVRAEIDYDDEIGYLGESFNHLMESLNAQIEHMSSQQKLIRESELRRLQSQINPHLLYNTLDSAMYLMTRGERERAVHILEEMSSYFKQALQQDRKIVTVGDSIRHCRTYLELQNSSRMKCYSLNVTGDKELEKALILHMLLQPLVENSVLHGFDANFTEGTVCIDLKRDGKDIIITVSDDGIGMDDRELEALREAVERPAPGNEGFALWNMVQRMHISYGQEHSIKIYSEFGSGTSVVLRIPLKFESEQDCEGEGKCIHL